MFISCFLLQVYLTLGYTLFFSSCGSSHAHVVGAHMHMFFNPLATSVCFDLDYISLILTESWGYPRLRLGVLILIAFLKGVSAGSIMELVFDWDIKFYITLLLGGSLLFPCLYATTGAAKWRDVNYLMAILLFVISIPIWLEYSLWIPREESLLSNSCAVTILLQISMRKKEEQGRNNSLLATNKYHVDGLRRKKKKKQFRYFNAFKAGESGLVSCHHVKSTHVPLSESETKTPHDIASANITDLGGTNLFHNDTVCRSKEEELMKLSQSMGPSSSSNNVEWMLQEICTDNSGTLVVYSTADANAVHLAMNGQDSSTISLLPLGFSVVPVNQPHVFEGISVNLASCLLTVAVQVLVSDFTTATLNVSTTAINNRICSTVYRLPYLLRSRKSSSAVDSVELQTRNEQLRERCRGCFGR
ncbi:hypothetical protein DY000_02054173 [Brassica cretica]|uniref:HD-Zip IV C-terminal domain-containing protein n=1 Tax=Brassica cretica TaxID=69181 RepID=A0ABQ7AA44_BRACR|nr:hypothetical protein DY000_02054173 [Brassica cretica]